MDPLKYIFQEPMPTGKLAKWQILLSEFDIVYITQKAIKGQALTDHLAENPVDNEYKPLTTYFPDEKVLLAREDISEPYSGWRMFFDGVSNFKGVRIGAVLVFETGDSDLLVHQVLGEWTTKNVKILPYLHCMKELCKQFREIDFKHVPRIQNEFADALATLSSMIQHPDKNYIDPIKVKIHDQQAYCFHIDEELDGQPWYYDIKKLLETRKYPKNATNKQKQTLRKMANHFFLNGEILYRRTSDLGLLRCVDATEATRLLEKVHAGTCGPHMNGFTLAKKILRAGYFWMTMERDSIRYVQKCHQCQVHGDFIQVPPNELNVMGSPWPFAACGMDVIGPIEPPASNGHRFILVAIDYFTKWVKASTYKAVTKKVVADFARNNIVCRFGIPESIITDNTTNLNTDLMRETCEKLRIAYQNSTAYRPQMNGAVEAANKNIKKILRKITNSHRQWHEKLPYALLGYRTTARTSTGATPYMLLYGSEAVILAEVEIPSLRIIQDISLDDAEWIRSRHEQLILIDEKRMDAVCHGQLYQNRMSKAFNKRDEAKGKFAPNWQGPYVVHRVLSGGALILADMDGKFCSNKYTWWNGRNEEECIFKRLDRVFGNQKFMDLFPSSEVSHFIRYGSDHAPLHVVWDSQEEPVIKFFKFLNIWTKHPKFLEVVQGNWCLDFAANPFIEFQGKMKKVKQALEQALAKRSKDNSGNILQQISTVEDVIKVNELQLELNP
ncbi:uncharacterized protein LOC132639380 [Lycium barbarum]|uniref:uncharacterized protein LOC132639380 n=1 Tax=Lycium barbarum TaxID=112863 RepID=UPI00293E6B51|nr:uncharacterized protein LOC132639380 [Lycium barbarum]